jgi:hypothetical protein
MEDGPGDPPRKTPIGAENGKLLSRFSRRCIVSQGEPHPIAVDRRHADVAVGHDRAHR